jgi:hypothetical protein
MKLKLTLKASSHQREAKTAPAQLQNLGETGFFFFFFFFFFFGIKLRHAENFLRSSRVILACSDLSEQRQSVNAPRLSSPAIVSLVFTMNPINGFMPGPRPFNKSAPAVVCPSYPCDLEEALIQHLPSADVSFVYMIAFIIICIWNLGHVIQCRAVSFSRFMVVGSLLEAGGYVGRAILASLPFEKTPFLL